jgi:macrolide transport system ATP-binding/permease protein
VLLVGAGMFAQSLSKLEHFDMKLDVANRYIIHFDPQSAGYSQAQLSALYRTIEDRFHQIPGMARVGLSTYTPMESFNDNTSVQIQGQPNPYKSSSYVWANSEYFDSVGTHVMMGRGFGPQDSPTAPGVAVVNQVFVKTFFGQGENPIGAHLGGPDSPGDFTIVGVVEDTTYGGVGWKEHSMFLCVCCSSRRETRSRPTTSSRGRSCWRLRGPWITWRHFRGKPSPASTRTCPW